MQRAFPEEEKQLDGHVGQGTAQVGDVQPKQLIYFVHVHVHAQPVHVSCVEIQWNLPKWSPELAIPAT